MKTFFTLLIAVACLLSFSVVAFAADPVDLTGKKGVVDPKDLKKDNPKPTKQQKTIPPAPGSSASDRKGELSRPNFKGTYSQAK